MVAAKGQLIVLGQLPAGSRSSGRQFDEFSWFDFV